MKLQSYSRLLTLQAITILSLFSHNIENRINQLSSLCVMPFGPVVSGTGLAKNEVIGSEDLAKEAGSDRIHGAGFQIHEDSAWDVPSTTGFVVVDIDALQLQIWVATILAGVVDAVLVADHFPELCSDLVTALTTLDVEDFSHFLGKVWRENKEIYKKGRKIQEWLQTSYKRTTEARKSFII